MRLVLGSARVRIPGVARRSEVRDFPAPAGEGWMAKIHPANSDPLSGPAVPVISPFLFSRNPGPMRDRAPGRFPYRCFAVFVPFELVRLLLAPCTSGSRLAWRLQWLADRRQWT